MLFLGQMTIVMETFTFLLELGNCCEDSCILDVRVRVVGVHRPRDCRRSSGMSGLGPRLKCGRGLRCTPVDAVLLEQRHLRARHAGFRDDELVDVGPDLPVRRLVHVLPRLQSVFAEFQELITSIT